MDTANLVPDGLTAQEYEAIRLRCRLWLTHAESGRAMGISRAKAGQLLDAVYRKLRQRGLTDKQFHDCLATVWGMTQRAIGEKTGRTQQAVSQALRRAREKCPSIGPALDYYGLRKASAEPWDDAAAEAVLAPERTTDNTTTFQAEWSNSRAADYWIWLGRLSLDLPDGTGYCGAPARLLEFAFLGKRQITRCCICNCFVPRYYVDSARPEVCFDCSPFEAQWGRAAYSLTSSWGGLGALLATAVA